MSDHSRRLHMCIWFIKHVACTHHSLTSCFHENNRLWLLQMPPKVSRLLLNRPRTTSAWLYRNRRSKPEHVTLYILTSFKRIVGFNLSCFRNGWKGPRLLGAFVSPLFVDLSVLPGELQAIKSLYFSRLFNVLFWLPCFGFLRSAGRGDPALRHPCHQLPQQDPGELRHEREARQHPLAQRQRQVLRVHPQRGDQLQRDPQCGAEWHATQGKRSTPTQHARARCACQV